MRDAAALVAVHRYLHDRQKLRQEQGARTRECKRVRNGRSLPPLCVCVQPRNRIDRFLSKDAVRSPASWPEPTPSPPPPPQHPRGIARLFQTQQAIDSTEDGHDTPSTIADTPSTSTDTPSSSSTDTTSTTTDTPSTTTTPSTTAEAGRKRKREVGAGDVGTRRTTTNRIERLFRQQQRAAATRTPHPPGDHAAITHAPRPAASASKGSIVHMFQQQSQTRPKPTRAPAYEVAR